MTPKRAAFAALIGEDALVGAVTTRIKLQPGQHSPMAERDRALPMLIAEHHCEDLVVITWKLQELERLLLAEEGGLSPYAAKLLEVVIEDVASLAEMHGDGL